jgi:hypothetical protein
LPKYIAYNSRGVFAQEFVYANVCHLKVKEGKELAFVQFNVLASPNLKISNSIVTTTHYTDTMSPIKSCHNTDFSCKK